MLAQKLTDGQREELEQLLPAAFVERDGEFRELAAGLADAAREHRAPLVPFYFYKLTESCVGCHARDYVDPASRWLRTASTKTVSISTT